MTYSFKPLTNDEAYKYRDKPRTVSPNGLYTVTSTYTAGATPDSHFYLTDTRTGKTSELFKPENVRNDYLNQIEGVSDQGAVAGSALIDGVYQGFIEQNGVIRAVNVPGSASAGWASLGASGAVNPPPTNSTRVAGVSYDGIVYGNFHDAAGRNHGFTEQNGIYSQIDVPGAEDGRSGIGGETATPFGGGVGLLVGEDLTPIPPPRIGPYVPTPPVQGTVQWFEADPVQGHFNVADQTTHFSSWEAGTPYAGPVPGLTSELILLTSDNLNIASTAPNVFIHSGSGLDALSVKVNGGNNVLDGGTGSNFLEGGNGQDVFYLDDRHPTATLWSTLTNFHAGDVATVWGLTLSDFTLSYADNQGAEGFKGLTIVATRVGQPDASLTIDGYTQADLAAGKLTMSFGRTGDLPGLGGSDYLTIAAH